MKKIFIYILCFSVGTTAQTILAQNTASNDSSVLEVPAGVTLDQVIDTYETALGGKEKLASVQSMETYLEMENPSMGGILIVMKQMEGHILQEFVLKSDMSSFDEGSDYARRFVYGPARTTDENASRSEKRVARIVG